MKRAFTAVLIAAFSALGARPPATLTPLAVQMLAAHNAYRAHVGVRPLVWSNSLALAAQSWADKLLKRGQFAHQQLNSSGENLFEMKGGTATPDDVLHDWASESLDYDYVSNRCHSMCGHYTQVVWRSTTAVGCAVAKGDGREVWVCEYSPPGNIMGQRPY